MTLTGTTTLIFLYQLVGWFYDLFILIAKVSLPMMVPDQMQYIAQLAGAIEYTNCISTDG